MEENNNSLRKSLTNLSSVWLLPLEILELILSQAHPQVLLRFGLTCKELHEYLLKNNSTVVLEHLWGKAYTKHVLNDIRYQKTLGRKFFILRSKSLYRIARSMKFDIEDSPDVEKKYARQYYNDDYDPHELEKLRLDVKDWNWCNRYETYGDNEDFERYQTLTPAEKQAVKKFSQPKKMRAYNMPDVSQFSTTSLYLMSLWLARRATIYCMSRCGDLIQPTLIHDLSIASSLELILLCAIFKQEELYRRALKEYIWQCRGYSERVHTDPEFQVRFPNIRMALSMEEGEVWKDTYSCRIVDWEKVHREHLQQQRLALEAKSRELEKMFGSQPSNDAKNE